MLYENGYKALVINDLHIPFTDMDLIDLVLQAGRDAKVDKIIINGDLLDLYNCSVYEKSKKVIINSETEIEAGLDFIKKLRKIFPDQEIVFLFGNHDDRLSRLVSNKLPSFYNFLSLEKMLQLEEYNIKWQEYQDEYFFDDCDLRAVHSPPSYSENGAMVSVKKKMDGNFIYACTHRIDSAYKTGVNGNLYRAFFNGWLGNKKKLLEWLKEVERDKEAIQLRKVFSYAKNHENWQDCFSFVHVFQGFFHVEQIPIENGRFIANNFYYSL